MLKIFYVKNDIIKYDYNSQELLEQLWKVIQPKIHSTNFQIIKIERNLRFTYVLIETE